MKEDNLPGLFKFLIKKYGLWKTSIFSLIFFLIVQIPGFIFGKNFPVSQTINVSPNFNNPNKSSERARGTQVLAEMDGDKKFSDNIKDWSTNFNDGPDEDGFYCPNNWSPYPAPDIIFNQLIPAIFNSLNFRYAIKNKDQKSNTPQTLVFSLGEKNSRVFRFYIPQTNPQSIGFERFDIDGKGNQKSIYDHGKELDDPIKPETPVGLTVRAQLLSGSKVSYTFNIKYISKVTQRQIESSTSYEVDLQDPDPKKLTTQIGIATFKGNCINFDTYNFSL